MPNAWIEALKEYNASKGMWCLPKKGSEEYKEVMEIVARKKGGKAKEEPVKVKDESKKKESSEERFEKRAKVRAFLEEIIRKRREKKAKENIKAEAKASRERILAKIAADKARKATGLGPKIIKEEKAKGKGKGKKVAEKAKKIEELERKVKSFMVNNIVIDAAGFRKATEELEEAKKNL